MEDRLFTVKAALFELSITNVCCSGTGILQIYMSLAITVYENKLHKHIL